ncbi:MAG: penicillin-binding protein 2 [Nitrospiraceae bacterium]|nr:penicillin-binding protein 2 [Nitrospiraceae bacterium]
MNFRLKTIWRIKRFDQEDLEVNKRRCEWAIAFLFLSMFILCARLCYLQVIMGKHFAEESKNNRMRSVRIQAPRGEILDRSGRLLAGVRPCFNVCIIREDVKNMEALLTKLYPLLGDTEAEIRTRLHVGNTEPKYIPIIIKRGVDWKTLSMIEARLSYLPGVSIEVTPAREYPHGSIAPHLLGYLGEINEKELRKGQYRNRYPGDLIGKCGIEARFESDLAGEDGQLRLEVDARGRMVKVIDKEPATPGDNLYLSIDLDLQQASQEAIKGKSGAVVAMDPRTGQILALVSSPGFDPDDFVKGISTRQWKALNNPVTRPLLNRAFQCSYAPGSTFKIVTASAALEEGVVTKNTILNCGSSYRLGRRVFRDWSWRGHGQTNMHKALVESCDTYFYQVGLKLGIKKIAKYAKAFGLGSKTGIDLPNENPGLIATPAWKYRRYHKPWQKGETLITAIGQGFTLVTPLQMARLIASVANGGRLYRPIYIKKILDSEGHTVASFPSEVMGIVPISRSHLRTIRLGLLGAVEEKKGTGKRCRLANIHVAGKTGTAQVIGQAKRRQNENTMPFKFRDHAWFVAYAPAERPELAVAVLVEHGGHGGSVAAPIARKVFKRWFQIQAPRPIIRSPKIANNIREGKDNHV